MAILETAFKWATFTSTGTGKAFNCRGMSQGMSFGLEASSGCTASYQILHRMGSSAGPYSVLSSGALSTGSFTTDQFMGPLEWVKPRITDKSANSTNVVDVYLMGS